MDKFEHGKREKREQTKQTNQTKKKGGCEALTVLSQSTARKVRYLLVTKKERR